MKHFYIGRNSDRLLVIYGGWTFRPEMLASYEAGNISVLMLYDYAYDHGEGVIPAEAEDIISAYDRVYVFAWSFGVACAEIFFPGKFRDRIVSAIAVNGTCIPVDDTYGIPVRIFEGTLVALDARNLFKFGLRMCGSKEIYEKYVSGITYDVEHLRKELYMLGSLSCPGAGASADMEMWTAALISDCDRIFPPENMRKYWTEKESVRVSEMECGHFPFFLWNSYDEILKLIENLSGLKAVL